MPRLESRLSYQSDHEAAASTPDNAVSRLSDGLYHPPGALESGMPVAGIRISREAGTTVRTASYLPDANAVFCRFLSSRKVCIPGSRWWR